MIRQSPILGAAALAIALGLALKGHRYAGQFEDRAAETMARIAAIAAADGWRPVAKAGVDLPFAYATFSKSGCDGVLRVAPMGASRELTAEIRLAFGQDTGFVDAGAANAAGAGTFFGASSKGLGLLAISPAPPGQSSVCGGPARAQWRQ
jgi:hypothetical protein